MKGREDPAPPERRERPTEAPALAGLSGGSQGKRDALELTEAAREAHRGRRFAGALFMGGCPWEVVHPFPAQSADDRAEGDRFLGRLEEFLRRKVDPDEIDRAGEIPREVLEGLAALGAFGMKVDPAHGGLGLSWTNYIRAMELLGSWCGNTTALLSAHQSIGVPQPLLLFGTEEQRRRFLPRLAGGEISAFALTETGVGSDPARMTTRAEPTADGRGFVLNGDKLWCTNGTRAGLIVVMARTPPRPGDPPSRTRITAFIVEADAPGVTVVLRSRFLGLRALYNGVIRFRDVEVPRENIILEEGKGLKVALTTLNAGRLALPAACAGLAKRCLGISRRWAAERVQWGAPIGHHAAVADKLAGMAATAFAVESTTLLTSLLADGGGIDLRIEAAMCKLLGSEAVWGVVDDTLQVRGGRGYETADSLRARGEEGIGVERFFRDARINTIFEGSSEILRLFIAREALDPHLKMAGGVLDARLPFWRRAPAAAGAAARYARWYPPQWLAPGRAPAGMDRALAGHAAWVDRESRRLARAVFHAMVRHGPKLEREQVLLGRFVDIGTDLFAAAAVCSRASALASAGDHPEEARALADLFCRKARLRVDEAFRRTRRNEDRRSYRLARQVLDGRYLWLEEGIVGAGGEPPEADPGRERAGGVAAAR